VFRRIGFVAAAVTMLAGAAIAGPPSTVPEDASGPPRLERDVMRGADALAMNVEEVRRLVRRGSVLLVDVRDWASYRHAHLPGAISVPLDKLPARAAILRSTGKIVVTYCNGPKGEKGMRAAAMLRQLGLAKAHALAGGFGGWVEEGHVVELKPSVG
jgi:rhodanese-related sulfurtransferase